MADLKQGDAKTLGKGAVKKYLTPDQHVPHMAVPHSPEQLNSIVELEALSHLLKDQPLRSVLHLCIDI